MGFDFGYDRNNNYLAQIKKLPLAHFKTTFTGFEGERGAPGVTSLFEPKIHHCGWSLFPFDDGMLAIMWLIQYLNLVYSRNSIGTHLILAHFIL